MPRHRRPPKRGEVPEWSIGAVSKTVVGLRPPWVRIPPSPPYPLEIDGILMRRPSRAVLACGTRLIRSGSRLSETDDAGGLRTGPHRGTRGMQCKRPPRRAAFSRSIQDTWRRVPESNRSSRICNPLRNLSANPPRCGGFRGFGGGRQSGTRGRWRDFPRGAAGRAPPSPSRGSPDRSAGRGLDALRCLHHGTEPGQFRGGRRETRGQSPSPTPQGPAQPCAKWPSGYITAPER